VRTLRAPLVIKWASTDRSSRAALTTRRIPIVVNSRKKIDCTAGSRTADVQEDHAGGICGKLRPRDGAEARAVRAVYGCTATRHCKTTRRLDQGKKVPDIPLDEKCPKCDRNLILRTGAMAECTSCSVYPECKYIKQNFIA